MNDQQWEKILKKYKGLMYMIGHRIGGDKIANDFDDSQQELALTAIDAVAAYTKKTGKKFDDFFGTVQFDKYIKTCLWNKKNNLGNKIKKKYGIRNCVSLSANPELFSTEQGEVYGSSSLEVQETVLSACEDVGLDNAEQEIVDCVLGDMRLIKPDGSFNISKLSRLTNKTKTEVRSAVDRMKHQLKDYNEDIN